MAVIKMKPTSPGMRGMVKISRDHLHKGEPYAPLLEPQFQKSGRNNNGHITVRHKGGGHKHHYRVVDFKRNKDAIPAKVERVEYDPNRTAHIALICYADGERAYIIAPRGLEVGATILSGSEAPIRVGNTLPIRNIPVGSTIHCIEMQIGKGAQIARSAGTSATLLAREGTYAQVRMRSGEVRKIHIECRATIGEVANEEHSLRRLGKAGVKRWMGIRPTVRGVVMNPVDHPHGGGEGKTGEGRLMQVLVAPIVSEKATMIAEKSNSVTFKVLQDATKYEVKAAVQLMFKVDVKAVAMVNIKGKTKRFGKSVGRRDNLRKAYVTLQAGQELNLGGESA